MSKYPQNMRVSVISGDGKTDLGFGTYTGDVNVYMFSMPDGSILSLDNAEEEPSDNTTQYLKDLGGKLEVIGDNPRIVLDSGRVVYGCQVWWSMFCG